jgi:hypothetical protein
MPSGSRRLEAARRRHRQRRTFWARFSRRDLMPFLPGVFCTFAALGFLLDIGRRGRLPGPYLMPTVVFSGSIATAYDQTLLLIRILASA